MWAAQLLGVYKTEATSRAVHGGTKQRNGDGRPVLRSTNAAATVVRPTSSSSSSQVSSITGKNSYESIAPVCAGHFSRRVSHRLFNLACYNRSTTVLILKRTLHLFDAVQSTLPIALALILLGLRRALNHIWQFPQKPAIMDVRPTLPGAPTSFQV